MLDISNSFLRRQFSEFLKYKKTPPPVLSIVKHLSFHKNSYSVIDIKLSGILESRNVSHAPRISGPFSEANIIRVSSNLESKCLTFRFVTCKPFDRKVRSEKFSLLDVSDEYL